MDKAKRVFELESEKGKIDNFMQFAYHLDRIIELFRVAVNKGAFTIHEVDGLDFSTANKTVIGHASDLFGKILRGEC